MDNEVLGCLASNRAAAHALLFDCTTADNIKDKLIKLDWYTEHLHKNLEAAVNLNPLHWVIEAMEAGAAEARAMPVLLHELRDTEQLRLRHISSRLWSRNRLRPQ